MLKGTGERIATAYTYGDQQKSDKRVLATLRGDQKGAYSHNKECQEAPSRTSPGTGMEDMKCLEREGVQDPLTTETIFMINGHPVMPKFICEMSYKRGEKRRGLGSVWWDGSLSRLLGSYRHGFQSQRSAC